MPCGACAAQSARLAAAESGRQQGAQRRDALVRWQLLRAVAELRASPIAHEIVAATPHLFAEARLRSVGLLDSQDRLTPGPSVAKPFLDSICDLSLTIS